MLSIVTNATENDYYRLKHFIPAIIRVFAASFDELIIVLETKPEEGRIKGQHNDTGNSLKFTGDRISEIKKMDNRIQVLDLNYDYLDGISRRWFSIGGINRCQGGTPIFAFLYGIEMAKNSNVFRCDCDMVFYDAGFIKNAGNLLDKFHIIQPPLLLKRQVSNFTTRAFFLNKSLIINSYPLIPYSLDLFRSIDRFFKGRSRFHSLEEILEYNQKLEKIKIYFFDNKNGNSMHIVNRQEFLDPRISNVINNFIKGDIPDKQLNTIDNYNQNFWL